MNQLCHSNHYFVRIGKHYSSKCLDHACIVTIFPLGNDPCHSRLQFYGRIDKYHSLNYITTILPLSDNPFILYCTQVTSLFPLYCVGNKPFHTKWALGINHFHSIQPLGNNPFQILFQWKKLINIQLNLCKYVYQQRVLVE